MLVTFQVEATPPYPSQRPSPGREMTQRGKTVVGLLGILVRVFWRNRSNRLGIDIQNEIYYEVLAHSIMVAEKSHNLLSRSWRPRKASDIVPIQT